MAPEEECEREMFVWIERAKERIAVPLAQLRPFIERSRPRRPSVIGSIGGSRVRAVSTPSMLSDSRGFDLCG